MFQIRNCLAHGLVAGAFASAALLSVPAAEAAATESVVYSFQGGADGGNPQADLIAVDGNLYGTTIGGGTGNCVTTYSSGPCGTVFKIDPTTGNEKVLYSFQGVPDGASPAAGLINVGGTLYGTTYNGGTVGGPGGSGEGTVFSFDLKTHKETVLHSFGNGGDGIWPEASLIDVNGTLYGTTYLGGTGSCFDSDFFPGCGIVFSINPTTGAEKVVHSFTPSEGSRLSTPLIDVNGTLYGTAFSGGPAYNCAAYGGCGTVFSLNPTTGKVKVVYSFCMNINGGGYCADGDQPEAGLIDVGGTLYGTTSQGGANASGAGSGTVFSFNPTTGAENVVYSFCMYGANHGVCTDGSSPEANLINVGGNLWSTTYLDGGEGCNGGGGVYAGCGTVFKVNPTTGAEKVVYSFCNQGSTSCTDGTYPEAGLIDVRGTLYGTTGYGGASGTGCGGSGCGTVFKITR